MDPEKALVLAREVAKALGGEQQLAIEQVCRMAERGNRRPSQEITAVQRPPSSQNIPAVTAREHFKNAQAHLPPKDPAEEK